VGCERNNELVAFILDRVAVYLRDQGIRYDVVAASQAVSGDILVALTKRVAAVQRFIDSEDGINLLQGYKRAANILKIEQKKDERIYSPEVVSSGPNMLGEEHRLSSMILDAKGAVASFLDIEDFNRAMVSLAALRSPVDSFFEAVMVNDADPSVRARRLGLLAALVDLMNKVADFSKIEG